MKPADSYLNWSIDDKPVALHMNPAVVQALAPLLNAGGEGRALEVGGILLGRVQETPSGRFVLQVDAFEPVECEHARGASWILSRSDRQSFAAQVRRWSKGRRDGTRALGWFRSHTRPGLFLDQHDWETCRDLFPQAWSVALLIRPEQNRAATAGYFFWEDGDIQRARPYSTFPFTAPPVAEAVCEAAVRVRRPVPQVSVPKGLLWAPAAAGIAVGVWWHPPAVPDFGRAGVEVQQVAVANPVSLPPPDVAELSLPPANAAEDRVVINAPAAKAEPEGTRARAVEARSVAAQVIPVTREIAAPEPARVPTALQAEREVAPESHVVAAAAVHEEPPVVLGPKREASLALASVEPARTSTLRRAVGSIPGLGFLKRKKVTEDFTPARAVRQVRPAAPDDLADEVPVRLRVAVGANGEVESAELLNKRVDPELARAALDAARKWRFDPAKLNDKAVETEVVLNFVFTNRRAI